MNKVKAWIHAFRLRTLPLSFSSILLGSFIAVAHESFNLKVFLLALLTTLFLQILSNLANDLGDSLSGADNNKRIGPERMVQSGVITISQMKCMVVLFVVLSLISGIWLVFEGAWHISVNSTIVMLLFGGAAIVAALNYTIGRNPYGYNGFGDLFVFLFFGLVGVIGCYYLFSGYVTADLLLPASSIGFLSAGVLNLNNMRDQKNDAETGKRTLVVKIGDKKARIYHTFLLVGAVGTALAYTILNWVSGWQLIYLITFPLLAINIKNVIFYDSPASLDSELKKLALSTLLFSITFGIGLII